MHIIVNQSAADMLFITNIYSYFLFQRTINQASLHDYGAISFMRMFATQRLPNHNAYFIGSIRSYEWEFYNTIYTWSTLVAYKEIFLHIRQEFTWGGLKYQPFESNMSFQKFNISNIISRKHWPKKGIILNSYAGNHTICIRRTTSYNSKKKKAIHMKPTHDRSNAWHHVQRIRKKQRPTIWYQ